MRIRAMILTGWVGLFVTGWAWHASGAGRAGERLDAASAALREAEALAAAEDYTAAVAKYDEALAALPADRATEAKRVRLERAKSLMLGGQLVAANSELRGLVEQLSADPATDAALLAEARGALANSRFYVTWVMRLEGLGRDEWEPEIEAARQEFKLLADRAASAGNETAAARHKENLEAAVRLARMDLSELQGLAIPKACNGCCNCSGKGGKCPLPAKKRGAGAGAGGESKLDESGH